MTARSHPHLPLRCRCRCAARADRPGRCHGEPGVRRARQTARVYMYKVEKHVDLSGEFPDQNLHEHVYCNPGDIALDGMWRVDHVDQASPPDTYGDERDVSVLASYGDDIDRTKWHFRMTNFADGDAQIKLFATCIRGTVEQAYGHRTTGARHGARRPAAQRTARQPERAVVRLGQRLPRRLLRRDAGLPT